MVHKIESGNAPPIRTQPRRLPIGKKKLEHEEIKKMLNNGIIEPSKSAWSSAIVLVPKKDGSTRFCVDYRKLNEVTIKDAYPLPRVDDCLDSLANSNGSAPWILTLALGKLVWRRMTRRTQHSPQALVSFISRSCHSGYAIVPAL